jgi:diacylglycerol O-acyltransferase
MVRAMFHQRLVNLGTSNLPGPPVPLYLAGARALEVFQIGGGAGTPTLSVGVLSHTGQLNFGVVGDADAVPDLAVFADGLSATLEELGIERQKPPFPVHGAAPPDTEILPGVTGRSGR